MIILRAYKTELDLNHTQKTACARHAGAARWAYNWAWLARWKPIERAKRFPPRSTAPGVEFIEAG